MQPFSHSDQPPPERSGASLVWDPGVARQVERYITFHEHTLNVAVHSDETRKPPSLLGLSIDGMCIGLTKMVA